ncbi:MAG: ABC transporter permease [Terriglobales bacterium]
MTNIWLTSSRVPGLSMGLPDELAARVAQLPEFSQSVRVAVEPRVWDFGARPQQVVTAFVTPGFFQILNLQPASGRFDHSGGSNNHVVVSWEAATSLLGGARAAVGRQIRLAGAIYTVSAVAPRNFDFPNFESPGFPVSTGVWVVHRAPPHDDLGDQTVLARIAPGVNRRTLQAELDRAAAAVNPAAGAHGARLRATTVRGEVTARRAPLALVLLGSGVLLWLVGVMIAALLLLEDALHRLPEMAVRTALGASRARLVRHALSETAAILPLLVIVSVAFAAGGWHLLRLWSPNLIAAAAAGRLLAWALVCAAGLASLSIMAAALLPPLSLPRAALAARPLRSTAHHARRLGPALVVCGIAFATLALYGALVFLRSAQRISGLKTGMDTTGIAAATIASPPGLGWNAAQRIAFRAALQAGINRMPGVVGSALSGAPVLAGAGFAHFAAMANGTRIPATIHRAVAPGYFKLLHIALLRGRAFTQTDAARPMTQAIISHSLAHQAWPRRNPVGHALQVGGSSLTILGVVADTRDNSLLQYPSPEIYTPLAQLLPSQFQITLLVRGNAPAQLTRAIDQLIWTHWPQLSVLHAGPLDASIARAEGPPRAESQATVVLAALTALLGMLGLFAWLQCEMQWHQHELAVRVACGATPAQILTLGIRRGTTCWAWGAGLGVICCLAIHPLIVHLLAAPPPLRAACLATPAVLTGFAAVAASLIPAWQASRVPPALLLRG